MSDIQIPVMCCFCGGRLSFDDAVEIAIRSPYDSEEVQTVLHV